MATNPDLTPRAKAFADTFIAGFAAGLKACRAEIDRLHDEFGSQEPTQALIRSWIDQQIRCAEKP